MKSRPPVDSPPRWFWLLPLVVAALRTLPWAWTYAVTPPPELDVLHVGYLPKDFLQYLAFIRQVPDDGSFFFYNPFTTEPQDGRFLLAFLWLLGAVCRFTGFSPSAVLELSRVPLTFLFFFVLWRFLAPIHPDRRTRLWTCVLVAFAGGLEGFVRPFAADLPTSVRDAFVQETWHLNGWSTFASSFNPLWLVGLTLSLVALGPILAPVDRADWRDAWRVGTALVAAYSTHPYSYAAVVAVWVAVVCTDRLVTEQPRWQKHRRIAVAVGAAILVVAALNVWQMQSAVYRLSAGGFFGPQAMSVSWYPLTLGALGLFALRGVRQWVLSANPYCSAVLAWLGAIVLLHSSTVVNGYHFVPYLHLPICILAASGVVLTLDEGVHSPRRRLATTIPIVLLFPSFVLVTLDSIGDVSRENVVPVAYAEIAESLRDLPPANGLVPVPLGHVIPAYTGHRVWVGHWFLSHDAAGKSELYEALSRDPARLDDLRRLLAQQKIRFFVLTKEHSDGLAPLLGDLVESRRNFGGFDLLLIRPPPA